MKRLKKITLFSGVCLLLISILNLIGIGICYITPFLFNEYSVWEYLIAGAIHSILIFVLILIGGIRYSFIFVPVIYLGCSLFLLTGWDMMSGYDFLFHIHFGFSRFVFITHEIILHIGFLEIVVSAVVFHGLFFAYQMGLLYATKKIFYRYFYAERKPSTGTTK